MISGYSYHYATIESSDDVMYEEIDGDPGLRVEHSGGTDDNR